MTHDDTSIQSSPDENTRSISLEHQLVRDAFEQFEDSSTDTVQPSSIDIPGYDILRELHRGGQGVVYLAHQKSTKRQVAIKLLLHGNFATPKARKRFEREVELVAQLDHPNIISIFDSGQTEQGMQFFVMDYIRGDQLRDHVRKNEMSVEEVIRLFQKICDAVQYAHQRGVIHRDLKPSNILVDPNGEPKVLDFGLAKSLENAEETIATISQDIVGTLPYMSPEQASGDGVGLDTRTDVYSLGVILYEILTGQYPYPVAGRMADVLRHIAETQPSPLSQAWNANSGVHERSTSRRSSVSSRRSGRSKCPIDGGMEVIVLTAIAKNKDRRYQSAGELGRDLDRYLKGEALYAKGDSLGYRMIVELKRRRRTLGSAAAILIAIAGVATYASARQNAILAEQEKRDADLARLLARASVENNWGEIEQAESLLEEALALEPGYWKALYERALLRKDLYFQRIPGDPELLAQAEADIRQVIPQQPNALRVHNLAAVIFTALGKGEEAIEAAEQVVRLEPPTDPRPRPNYRSVLAKALAADGRLNEALAAVEEGVSFANDAPNRFSRWYSGVYRTLAILRWVVG
ncbi:MAG: serine/threonine protein kinase, partial [Phycisphaerae bacterium]